MRETSGVRPVAVREFPVRSSRIEWVIDGGTCSATVHGELKVFPQQSLSFLVCLYCNKRPVSTRPTLELGVGASNTTALDRFRRRSRRIATGQAGCTLTESHSSGFVFLIFFSCYFTGPDGPVHLLNGVRKYSFYSNCLSFKFLGQ